MENGLIKYIGGELAKGASKAVQDTASSTLNTILTGAATKAGVEAGTGLLLELLSQYNTLLEYLT